MKLITNLLFVTILNIGLIAYAEDSTTEKATFDLPDLVIQSQDKSQRDLIEKVKSEQQEISFDKETPPLKKIEPELLLTEKQSVVMQTKKELGVINQFRFGLGNINLLRYGFIHGQTFKDHNFMLGLSRYLINDYIPQGGSSNDELSCDYAKQLTASSRIRLSSRMERRQALLPGNVSTASGNYLLTYVPINALYSNKISASENIEARVSLENIDIYADSSLLNWFGLDTEVNYELDLPNYLTLLAKGQLNNSISMFDASLSYQLDEENKYQALFGIQYFQSFLPRVVNESMFALKIQGRADISPDTTFKFSYAPGIPAIGLAERLLSKAYSEVNYQLIPQVDVINWQVQWQQRWMPKLSSSTRFDFRRSKQVIGMADTNANRFIEPANLGWGSLIDLEFSLDYVLTEQLSGSFITNLKNYRNEGGTRIPSIYDSITFRLNYAEQKEGLTASAAIRYLGSQTDVLDLTNTLPEVVLVDLEASKKINSQLKLNAKIENLLNASYSLRGDYKAPGLSIEFGGEVAL